VQNLPDDDTTSIDGQPDYAETYEQLDAIDLLNSVNVKGVTLNLDPTLKLKMEREEVGQALVKKGSENAIVTGLSGDASYLELGGTAVTAGHATIDKQREQVLETCQCVVPDPDEVVGSATSSVALKIVYAPMLAKGDIMRDQYGEAIVRLLEGMLRTARRLNVGGTIVEEHVDEAGDPLLDDAGHPMADEVEYTVVLPPKRDKVEVLDEQGNGTGKFTVQTSPHVPGEGDLWLEWPDYFKQTSDDHQKEATALTLSTGGKPVMSQQTAVEQLATAMQRDPQDEWSRLRAEQQQRRQGESSMFPSAAGEVTTGDELPDGSEPMEGEGGETSETESAAPAQV
jgi:hypothetical protein